MSTDLLITLTADEKDASNVTIAFTMGVKALEKGHKTEVMLLSSAVHLGVPGYADKIDIGEPFSPVQDILQSFLDHGGMIKACSSCLKHNGIKAEDLLEGAVVITADDVIDGLMDAKKSLQLN